MEPTIVLGNLSNTALPMRRFLDPLCPLWYMISRRTCPNSSSDHGRLGYIFSKRKKTTTTSLSAVPQEVFASTIRCFISQTPTFLWGNEHLGRKSHGHHGFDFSNERSVFEQRSPQAPKPYLSSLYEMDPKTYSFITRWLS